MESKFNNPLQSLDHWEDDLLERYPEKDLKTKEEEIARKEIEIQKAKERVQQ